MSGREEKNEPDDPCDAEDQKKAPKKRRGDKKPPMVPPTPIPGSGDEWPNLWDTTPSG